METKDRSEADRLVFHKNEAQNTSAINHRIGMNYLSAADPDYSGEFSPLELTPFPGRNWTLRHGWAALLPWAQ